MVKAYLRYDGDRSIGIISSRECNVLYDKTGKQAITGAVESVGLWNLRQGTLVRELKTAKGSEKVTRLCLKGGSDAVVAAGYTDGAVRLWDLNNGCALQTLHGHKSGVNCLAFDRKGHLLASGANDTDIVIWDLAAEAGVARLRGHVDQVTAVVFWHCATVGSPDPVQANRVISASKDRIVRIWSIELQICLQTIAEHQTEVWSLALNDDQTRLVAGSSDKFLRMWALSNTAAGTDEEPLATYSGAVQRPNGQGSALSLEFVKPNALDFEVLLCQGAGKVLEIFRCHMDKDAKRRQKRRKTRAQGRKAKKAKLAGAADEGEDAEDAEDAAGDAADDTEKGVAAADELQELTPHRLSAKATSMNFCKATGEVMVSLSNNELQSVKLLPSESDGSIVTEAGVGLDTPGHRTAVRAMAVSADDSMLMTASAEAVKIWNTATGRCVRTMASGYGLCGFFVSGNDHLILGTKEGAIELYDLRLAELVETLTPHTGPVYGIAEAPDKKGFVTCSGDKTLRFFELGLTTGQDSSVSIQEVAEKATELPDECLAVAYSPNGKWVAVALLNHTVQMMFTDTMKFYLSLYGHRLPVMSVDISSDSQIVASGSADKNVKLWSTQFGNCHRSLRAHEESVMQVKFLPGTHYLATASRDRDLKLWDCDKYELITCLKGHVAEILSMALSADAAFIVTASSDRQMRFWKRSGEQLFLSEERAKELEDKFEQEAEREDVQVGGGASSEIVALRPSRRTIESVRSTERLMEILDEAVASEAGEEDLARSMGLSRHPCARVIAYVNTLTSANIYEVLLALPFSHALRLLTFICRFFEAAATLGEGDSGPIRDAQLLSAGASLETACQAALISTYVHHTELASTPSARNLIMRLRGHMRKLLTAEKDRIGLSLAGFAHLQRTMKRAGGSLVAAPAPKAPAAKAAGKKRRR